LVMFFFHLARYMYPPVNEHGNGTQHVN